MTHKPGLARRQSQKFKTVAKNKIVIKILFCHPLQSREISSSM
jgi:hypothetical protein